MKISAVSENKEPVIYIYSISSSNYKNDAYLDTNNLVRIDLKRSTLRKAFSVIILLALIIVCIFLPSINDIGSLIQSILAIMFGLFGVKQILLPQNINEITVIDMSIYFIYVLLSFSVLLATLKIYLNKNANLQKEIDNKLILLSRSRLPSEFLRILVSTKLENEVIERSDQDLLQDLILKN